MKGDCFIIMPFGGNFDDYWCEIIKPVVTKCGYLPIRADDIFGTRSIIKDIYENISKSKLVIADVTNKNPNVNYELGMAHTLGKPVIILTQDINDVPFDYKHIRCIFYDTAQVRWQNHLEICINNTIKEIEKDFIKHAVFNRTQLFELDDIKTHLKNIIFQIKANISKDEIVECDVLGNCVLKQKWEITPQRDLSHFSQCVTIGKPGKIEVVKVFDLMNHRKLKTIDFERTDVKLFYGILFDELKLSNQKILLDVEIYAENFLSELVDVGKDSAFYQSSAKSNVSYSGIRQKFIFPNVNKFQNISARYFQPIDKNLQDKKIKIIKKKRK